MRFKCYDHYRKQHLIMEVMEDELWDLDSFSSRYCTGKLHVKFHIDDDSEDPHPKRWSDLVGWEIIS